MLRYITGYIAIVVFPAGYRMFGSMPSGKCTLQNTKEVDLKFMFINQLTNKL